MIQRLIHSFQETKEQVKAVDAEQETETEETKELRVQNVIRTSCLPKSKTSPFS